MNYSEALELIETHEPPKLKRDNYINNQVVKEISQMFKRYEGLAPKVFIAYDRIAMFGKDDPELRVTFDKNIVGTSEIGSFFDDILPGIPLLPTGQHILEVKYDEFLPDYIKQILNEVHLQKTAFSKYYYSRRNRNIYG